MLRVAMMCAAIVLCYTRDDERQITTPPNENVAFSMESGSSDDDVAGVSDNLDIGSLFPTDVVPSNLTDTVSSGDTEVSSDHTLIGSSDHTDPASQLLLPGNPKNWTVPVSRDRNSTFTGKLYIVGQATNCSLQGPNSSLWKPSWRILYNLTSDGLSLVLVRLVIRPINNNNETHVLNATVFRGYNRDSILITVYLHSESQSIKTDEFSNSYVTNYTVGQGRPVREFEAAKEYQYILDDSAKFGFKMNQSSVIAPGKIDNGTYRMMLYRRYGKYFDYTVLIVHVLVDNRQGTKGPNSTTPWVDTTTSTTKRGTPTGPKEPTFDYGLIVLGNQCPHITTSEGIVSNETYLRTPYNLLVCGYQNDTISWPDGKYCTYRAPQGSCPHGLDQEDIVGAVLVPNRCCKTNYPPTTPVPWVDGWTETFYLLPYKNYSCQEIESFKDKPVQWNSRETSPLSPSLTLCEYVYHDLGDAERDDDSRQILGSTLGPISVLIMGGSLLIYRKRRLKRKKRQTHLQMMLNGPDKDIKTKGKRGLEIGSLLKMILDPESQMTIYGLLVHPDHIEIMERVGKGAFGTVHQGRYRPDNNPLNAQEVAIKTLKENCVYPEISAFMEEAIVMADFRHVNVLSIVGVCIDPKTEVPSLVLPFMRHGDLQKYLRGFRYDDDKKDQTPELPQLLSFCQHIARGMAYLANMKFVHRDLAARNCMLNGDLVVKVADFGLTRDIYSSSYYRQDKNKLLPIKWMALESLQDRVFSTYTDVWSYGITVWEIFTLGKVPYPNLENIEVLPQLEKGQRLPKPDTCPDSVYDIMTRCWDENPKERPSFSDICEILETTLAGLLDYLDLDRGKTEALDLSTGVVSSPRESIQPVPPPSRSTYADYRIAQNPETSQIPAELERF